MSDLRRHATLIGWTPAHGRRTTSHAASHTPTLSRFCLTGASARKIVRQDGHELVREHVAGPCCKLIGKAELLLQTRCPQCVCSGAVVHISWHGSRVRRVARCMEQAQPCKHEGLCYTAMCNAHRHVSAVLSECPAWCGKLSVDALREASCWYHHRADAAPAGTSKWHPVLHRSPVAVKDKVIGGHGMCQRTRRVSITSLAAGGVA